MTIDPTRHAEAKAKAECNPSVGIRVTDPYRDDRRSGIVRAVLGNPRYVMVLCDDDVMRTMDCRTLVTNQEG